MSLDHIRQQTDSLVGPGRVETLDNYRFRRQSAGKRAVIVQIPVHPKEANLQATLQHYVDRPDIHEAPFRTLMLINNGTIEDTDARLAEVETFTRMYPDFPLDVRFTRGGKVFDTISQVRAVLGRFALEALPDSSCDTLHGSLFVTHDADMMELSPGYFSIAHSTFDQPGVHAMGGGIEFRSNSPILKALYRVEDGLYIENLAAQHVMPRLCGANSIYRASAYVDSDGHALQLLRKENTPIRRYLLKQYGWGAVPYVPEASIATSPRRAITVLDNGGDFSYQRDNFGKDEDVLGSYMGQSERDTLIADTYTPEEQCAFLGRQLSSMLQREIVVNLAYHNSKLRKMKDRGLGESIAYVLSQPDFHQTVVYMKDMFDRVCKSADIQATITDDLNVTVESFK